MRYLSKSFELGAPGGRVWWVLAGLPAFMASLTVPSCGKAYTDNINCLGLYGTPDLLQDALPSARYAFVGTVTAIDSDCGCNSSGDGPLVSLFVTEGVIGAEDGETVELFWKTFNCDGSPEQGEDWEDPGVSLGEDWEVVSFSDGVLAGCTSFPLSDPEAEWRVELIRGYADGSDTLDKGE